ncbi:hypothetical protein CAUPRSCDRAFT_11452, partial [Caulochytrium protostelioides]
GADLANLVTASAADAGVHAAPSDEEDHNDDDDAPPTPLPKETENVVIVQDTPCVQVTSEDEDNACLAPPPQESTPPESPAVLAQLANNAAAAAAAAAAPSDAATVATPSAVTPAAPAVKITTPQDSAPPPPSTDPEVAAAVAAAAVAMSSAHPNPNPGLIAQMVSPPMTPGSSSMYGPDDLDMEESAFDGVRGGAAALGDFLSKQFSKLMTTAPEPLERSYRVVHQRMKERMTRQAHVTAQPDVDEAAKQVEEMWDYFKNLEKLVERQRSILQSLNDTENELSLLYQQKGYQEEDDGIGSHLVQLGIAYNNACKDREPMIKSVEAFLLFIKTFKNKAIKDSLDTMQRQQTSRQALDSYGTKLGLLEEKAAKQAQRSTSPSEASRSEEDGPSQLERELEITRQRFAESKKRYDALSVMTIDKAGLLELKREADMNAHLAKIVKATQAFNRRGYAMEEVS